MKSQHSCPIWNTDAEATPLNGSVNGHRYDSPRAGGSYIVPRLTENVLRGCDQEIAARLTTWLVDQRRLGNNVPEVTKEDINRARRGKRLPVQERANRLLQLYAEHAPEPAKEFTVDLDRRIPMDLCEMHNLLAHCASTLLGQTDNHDAACRELEFYNGYFEKSGWITRSGYSHRFTVMGWTHLDTLRATQVESSQAFVAMWFDPSMDDVWSKGFESAIADAGYKAMRIDWKPHNNKIDDEIIAEIRRSRLLVADFTHGKDGARGGVYYEAGFAHGLGIPVVFTARKDMETVIHFDTRQFNHIFWETPEDLWEKLSNRISATVGDGPLKDRDPT